MSTFIVGRMARMGWDMKHWSVGVALAASLVLAVMPGVVLADGLPGGSDPAAVGVDIGTVPSDGADVAAEPASGGAVTVLVAGGVAQATAGGLTLPAPDPSLAFVAPSPDQPNYSARLGAFLQATVPDAWHGQSVGLLSALNDAGGVDVLGLPTSSPTADPHNPNFVYQRFQNGVLFYNATDASIQALGF